MSVAFRRDIDEEHLEPKFEIPIPPGPNLVTPRGLSLIQSKVSKLEALLPNLTEEKAQAEAKRELRYWGTRQATAQIVPLPTGETVEIGCTIGFRHNGKDRRIDIVGDDEAEPTTGLIAFSAPLARAMMGAEEGEVLPFGGKDQAIEIVDIAVSKNWAA